MVHKVNSGHPGGSLGCAEFFVTLYNVIIDRNDGFEMDGVGEDLFFHLLGCHSTHPIISQISFTVPCTSFLYFL